MYTLKDHGIIHEMECGSNFGYILEDSKYFVSTDYKVLQSQTSNIFVPCMKMLLNGKIELFYVTEELRPMLSMCSGIEPDRLIHIVVNLFESVISIRNNGFLSGQNIDISWDKIFVEPNTLKVKLVYLPVNEKVFGSYAEFESELRASLTKLIAKTLSLTSERMEEFVSDLSSGSMSLEDIYHKFCAAGMASFPLSGELEQKESVREQGTLKMVAMNRPEYFEIVLDRDELVIGRKQEIVDVVVPFSNMISRRHCRISRRDGGYVLYDEGSANGTYVNQTRVAQGQSVSIHRGDTIRLADNDFQLI